MPPWTDGRARSAHRRILSVSRVEVGKCRTVRLPRGALITGGNYLVIAHDYRAVFTAQTDERSSTRVGNIEVVVLLACPVIHGVSSGRIYRSIRGNHIKYTIPGGSRQSEQLIGPYPLALFRLSSRSISAAYESESVMLLSCACWLCASTLTRFRSLLRHAARAVHAAADACHALDRS